MIRERAGVDDVLTRGGRVTGVRTPHGDVEAETVVLCTGMWTPQVAALAGVAVAIQPVEHHYVLSHPVGAEVDTLPVVRDPDRCIYFRGRDGRLMLGAFQATSKPWLVDRVPDDFAFSLLDPDWEHFAAPLAAGRGRLPQLDALGIETFVNGPEGFTPDGNPLVGAVPGVAGLYVSAGFNSSGIAYGGGVGEALAQWIEAGEQPFDMWALDVRRFGPAQARREFLRARGVEVLGTHMRLAYPGIEWSEGRGLNRSALHGRLAAAGASFGEKLGVERANWFSRNGTELRYSFGRPSWFADSAAEHAATRTAAGLFDVSSFAKLRVTGPGAPALLQRACAGDVDVAPGRVVYTAMLTARGTFASDLTVIRGEDDFTVITGTAHRVADRAWLEDLREEDAVLADVTDETAVLALMGPAARDILQPLTGADLSLAAFPFSTAQEIDVAGVRCRAVRITYVGELGWELHVPRGDAGRVYDALHAAGDVDRRRLPRDQLAAAGEGLPPVGRGHHAQRHAAGGRAGVRGGLGHGVPRARRAARPARGRAAHAPARLAPARRPRAGAVGRRAVLPRRGVRRLHDVRRVRAHARRVRRARLPGAGRAGDARARRVGRLRGGRGRRARGRPRVAAPALRPRAGENPGVTDFARPGPLRRGRARLRPRRRVTPFSVTENPSFRLEEPGREPVVLRIYHPGNRPEIEIRSELAWMDALRTETAVRVPDAGQHARRPRRGRARRPGLRRRVHVAPGHELDDDSLPSTVAAVGEITARLHAHARAWPPPPWFSRPRWDLRTTLGDSPHWGRWQTGVLDPEQERQLERLDAVVQRRLRAWGDGPERFGLMHADLRMTNVFADGDDLTIIDFDDAGYSWFLYDVGGMLTFCEGRPDVDEIVAGWADGYRRVAPLSAEEEREIPTFLMLRRLLVHAYLGFRSDTDLAAEAHAAGYGAESCTVAERYLSRFG